MHETRGKLTEYWDNLISNRLPSYVHLSKLEEEFKEHFSFLRWAFKRIILPLAAAYILAGILLKTNVLSSLALALIIFLYSNFLPDTDFLMKETKDKKQGSKWHEKYSLLFFAPIIIYYILDGRKKPIYTAKSKYFHNFKTALIYGLFLLIISLILWQQPLKIFILPLFGILGFSFHLMVDGRIKNIFRRTQPNKATKSF